MTFPPTGPQPGPPRPGRPSAAKLLAVLLAIGLLLVAAIAVTQILEARRAGREAAELRERLEGSRRVEPERGPAAPAQNPLLELLRELLGDAGLRGDAGLVECLAGGLAGGPPPTGNGPQDDVRAVARDVERIRELRFEEPVEPEFVSPAQIAQRVRRLFLRDYTERLADADRHLLVALGAVPAGLDLREVRARALEGQVAGFYVPSSDELVVRVAGGELAATDRITLAHELQHALADQRFRLPVPERLRLGREDADLAALALVEGDATLTMQRYALSLPFRDQLASFDPAALAEAAAALRGVPPYLERELVFPYEAGLRFVCHLFATGGWEAVNRAYEEPPASTAQVLFPGRYLAREQPVDPADPPSPGPRWRAGPVRSFGAANLLWLLEAPGGRPGRAVADALSAASGWAGGEAHVWTRGTETSVALVLAERPGTDVLCGAAVSWYRAAFPGAGPVAARLGEELAVDGSSQDAVVACAEDSVTIAIAPDLGVARAMV